MTFKTPPAYAAMQPKRDQSPADFGRPMGSSADETSSENNTNTINLNRYFRPSNGGKVPAKCGIQTSNPRVEKVGVEDLGPNVIFGVSIKNKT